MYTALCAWSECVKHIQDIFGDEEMISLYLLSLNSAPNPKDRGNNIQRQTQVHREAWSPLEPNHTLYNMHLCWFP